MKKELFEKIIIDNKTIKFNANNFCFFRFKPDNIIIVFSFEHRGKLKESFLDPNRRIDLSVGHFNQFDKTTAYKEIEETSIILVNSDDFNYAMTFLLTVDPINRIVKVQIQDTPEFAWEDITEEERNGIEIGY